MQPTATLSPAPVWSGPQKIAFRFFFGYFVLYTLPFVDGLWHALIPWVGAHLLQLPQPITTFTNGSGDTTYDYVLVGCMVVLAWIATVVWSVLDRRRANYNVLLYWLTVLVRYYLAFVMFSYGFAKVFKTQFPYPDLRRLLQPYGDSSPMGLAWTFLGFSLGYNWFMGLAEVGGAALLLFRRTTTLGALVLAGTSANILAINLFYDVPVKLFSSNLLLMALFLAALDGRRLLNLFFLNRPVAKANHAPFFKDRRWRIAGWVVKGIFIGGNLYTNVNQGFENARQYGDAAPKPPLYGYYDVQTFAVNADTLAPLTTDTTRWRKLVIGSSRFANVRMMNDTLQRYNLKLDPAKRSLLLTNRDDTLRRYTFTYVRPDSGTLVLRGSGYRRDSLFLRLHAQPVEQFLLTSRGFRWVNEFPFNR